MTWALMVVVAVEANDGLKNRRLLSFTDMSKLTSPCLYISLETSLLRSAR